MSKYLSSATIGFIALAAMLAGCGNSTRHGSSVSEHTTSGARPATSSLPSFTSAESKLPQTFRAPVRMHDAFTLGYLNPVAGNETLDAQQTAAEAETKALGGRTIAYGVNANPTTEAADFKLLLSQHVTAISLQPTIPQALRPLLVQAKAAGVPVVATATPALAGPPLPGYVSDVMEGVDRCAYLNVKTIAQAQPDATYALIPSAIPAPALQDLMARTRYWAAKFGLRYVGQVSAGQQATSTAGSTAMSAIIERYPTVKSVFVFTDAVAEGAAVAQKTRAGGKIKVVGLSGEKAAVQQIQQGTMFATCAVDNAQIGKQIAIAAFDAQTHQHLPLPKEIAVTPHEITHGNS